MLSNGHRTFHKMPVHNLYTHILSDGWLGFFFFSCYTQQPFPFDRRLQKHETERCWEKLAHQLACLYDNCLLFRKSCWDLGLLYFFCLFILGGYFGFSNFSFLKMLTSNTLIYTSGKLKHWEQTQAYFLSQYCFPPLADFMCVLQGHMWWRLNDLSPHCSSA